MSYKIDVTVTVTVRKSNSSAFNTDGRTGATMSQTVSHTSGGPNERYWYDPAETCATAATVDVLKMMEATYGRATSRD